ncbi:hypothetical protein NT6N_18430 [Oceaniferula spumae]|uniref:SLA1 homology domain-containing protein n=1 Tax=Oceaniferula spumae TaxID=2979115 RepID=A0AAT9FLH5_9BACT
MIFSNRYLVLACLLIFSWLPAEADEAKLTDSRVWHGKNGKHFRGKFLGRDGETLRIQDTRGKIYNVPITSLSDDDRDWFKKAWDVQQEKENEIDALAKGGEVLIPKDFVLPSVAPIGFKRVPDESVTRRNIPPIDQSEYYDKDHNNFASSFVPFMLWWHTSKIVDVPSRRDDNERRIEWLYKTLNKCRFGQRHARNSYQSFFQEELKTTACFEVLDLRDALTVHAAHKTLDRFNPEFLSQFTKGANATILSVSVYKGSRHEWTPDLPLVECTPGGGVIFYMYGLKLSGKLEKLPAGKDRNAVQGYEIKILNMSDQPDWFQARDYSFKLEGKSGTGLVVVVPNVADTAPAETDK